MVRSGRPVRLELNAQRVTEAMRFYRALFGWTSIPLHVAPWGSIPLIANGDRIFANEFMAMGAFAPPHWKIWFSADVDKAENAAREQGCDLGQGIYTLGDLGRLLDVSKGGASVSTIALNADPPEDDAAGDPCLAEMWGRDASEQAALVASVLGLEHVRTPRGAKLVENGKPRLFFRDVPFDLPKPIWIPYFRSEGVGGDCERARRLGAIVQVHMETIEDIGEVVVLSDPAGAYFGLVDPFK